MSLAVRVGLERVSLLGVAATDEGSDATMVLLCAGCPTKTAAAAFQDERYGKDMRVCNPTKSGMGRCTCCSREHSPANKGKAASEER